MHSTSVDICLIAQFTNREVEIKLKFNVELVQDFSVDVALLIVRSSAVVMKT